MITDGLFYSLNKNGYLTAIAVQNEELIVVLERDVEGGKVGDAAGVVGGLVVGVGRLGQKWI